jgi:hypothetical protein
MRYVEYGDGIICSLISNQYRQVQWSSARYSINAVQGPIEKCKRRVCY